MFSPVRCSGARDSCDSATTGTFEFLGEDLERARDLADFLLAALRVHRPLDELQVVDDHHLDPRLRLETARARTDLEQREPGRVVDPDGRLPEQRRGLGEIGVILAVELAGPQTLGIDESLGSEHALDEGFLTHFERKYRRRNVALDRGVLRDVQHERRLSHRRTRRDDDQVGRLEPERDLVEVREARGDAGERPAFAQQLDALHRRPEQLLDAHEPVGAALLAHLEDAMLGQVDEVGRVGADSCASTTSPCATSIRRRRSAFSFTILAVVLDVRRGRHDVEQRADVVLAAGRRRARPASRARSRASAGRGPRPAGAGRASRGRCGGAPRGRTSSRRRVPTRAHDRVGVEQHRAQHRLLRVLRIRGRRSRNGSRAACGAIENSTGELDIFPGGALPRSDCGAARRGGR